MFTNVSAQSAAVTVSAMEHFQDTIGTLFKMSDEELVSGFGTTTPTAVNVEELLAHSDFAFVERGSGRHAVVYADGRPSAVLFIGLSGD